ncbi:MAG: hypothetical protein Q8898_06175 [Bacillota bacterium]|nr:hypothetical protein [Bacillota bacterium]
MSLKLIELQIALPRTLEAGKMQEQQQQRGQLANHQASIALHKEVEKKSTTVVKQEQKGKTELYQDGKGTNEHNDEKPQKRKKLENKQEKHPYKGTLVDFSG